MWDAQVTWKPASPSDLCSCILVYPVIQLLFKSSHSLFNVFAKFKPILPAGVNHSCSIIPAEKLSKDVSQIFIETSDSGCLLAGARSGVGHRGVSLLEIRFFALHHCHSNSSFIFQLHVCLSANCWTSYGQEEKEADVFFQAACLAVFQLSLKLCVDHVSISNHS